MAVDRDRLLGQLDRIDRDRVRRVADLTVLRAARWSRGAAVRAHAALPRQGYVPRLLSIVVPAYNVEDYIDECLSSLRSQKYRRVEIIVVDDGSPDDSADVARSHARRDPRVRVVTRPNGGLSAARNTGVAAARGEFLAFVDSDDVVTRDAYSRALEALAESGSDFAVMHYDRILAGLRKPAAKWIRAAHDEERLACTLEEFPDVQVNAVAWSKVYRRSFYDRAGLRFPEDVLYEDQPVSAAAYAAARTFDVLPHIGVSWRIRDDKSSISQQSWTAPNLRAQIVATETSLEILERAGHTGAAEQRAIQLMAHNLPQFTKHALDTDVEYWELLRTATDDLRRRIQTPEYFAHVHAEHKVLNELVLRDRRQEAQDFIAAQGLEVRQFETSAVPDGIRCALPVTATDLPEELLLLAEGQLDLAHRLSRVQWTGDRLAVEGWAYIRNLDLATYPPDISLRLVDDTGRSVDLEVQTRNEPRVDDFTQHWYCDYKPGGFTASLAVDDLPEDDATWRFEVTCEAAGVRRTSWLDNLSGAGSAANTHTLLSGGGRVLSVGRGEDDDLRLFARTQQVAALSHSVRDGRLVVEFEAPTATGVSLASTRDPDATTATGTVSPLGGGRWRGEVDLPARPRRPRGAGRVVRNHHVLVDEGRKRRTVLLAPAGAPAQEAAGTGPAEVGVGADPDGHLRVSQRVVDAEVTSVRVDDLALLLTVRTVGLDGDRLTPVLGSGNRSLTGKAQREPDGTLTLRFPLTATRWGVDDLVVPQGRYYLRLELADGEGAVRPTLSEDVVKRLPIDELQERVRVRLEQGPGDPASLNLTILPPLREEERGVRNQRLIREAARVDRADLDGVFFRSLYGEVTNCNTRAVHDELVHRGSGLELIWSIQDYSIAVPPGGVGLIEGSTPWHRALARCRYQMVNVHQLSWFEKPEGQKIIQTMHGYPFKVMGHEWWEKGGVGPAHVASYDRRAREWDYFVSPARYATPLLTEAFLAPAGATPEILEIGYPRNDVLLSGEADKIRRRVRELLGIKPDQKVVLYAPTFRDYMSADDMRAGIVDFFDVAKAARRLGPKYVFLMRGHAFNARAKQRYEDAESVIDVTEYPEVSDLCLASDAAILDYSSLRFDYGLTGKPMIFFTPDLEQYDAARGGVIDYLPTAPGPVVRRTRDVIDQLRRLDDLGARHAAEMRTFRSTYLDLEDGHATRRLVDAVFSEEDAPRRGD